MYPAINLLGGERLKECLFESVFIVHPMMALNSKHMIENTKVYMFSFSDLLSNPVSKARL